MEAEVAVEVQVVGRFVVVLPDEVASSGHSSACQFGCVKSLFFFFWFGLASGGNAAGYRDGGAVFV